MESVMIAATLLTAAKAGLLGLLAAAAIDWEVFVKWQNPDAVRDFNWKIALFRWGKGFAIGFGGVVVSAIVAWARS